MSEQERKAFEAMLAALYSIYEVDDFGEEGHATVNIDYDLVEAALEAVKQLPEYR